MTKPKTFEEQYPTIHRFVEENGWIEIGQNDMIASFVRAYDEGGTAGTTTIRVKLYHDRLETFE